MKPIALFTLVVSVLLLAMGCSSTLEAKRMSGTDLYLLFETPGNW